MKGESGSSGLDEDVTGGDFFYDSAVKAQEEAAVFVEAGGDASDASIGGFGGDAFPECERHVDPGVANQVESLL